MPHQKVQSVKIGAVELEHRHPRETGQHACRQARRDRVEGPTAPQPPPPEERRRAHASASGDAHVAVFAIDSFGDLTLAASSGSVGVTAFNGVAISD